MPFKTKQTSLLHNIACHLFIFHKYSSSVKNMLHILDNFFANYRCTFNKLPFINPPFSLNRHFFHARIQAHVKTTS